MLEFGRGAAAFKNGDYEIAAEAFGGAVLSGDPRLRAQAHYNLGNSIYQRAARLAKEAKPKTLAKLTFIDGLIRQLENGLENYQQALTLEPADKNIKANHDTTDELIQKLRKLREAMAQAQGKGKKKKGKKGEGENPGKGKGKGDGTGQGPNGDEESDEEGEGKGEGAGSEPEGKEAKEAREKSNEEKEGKIGEQGEPPGGDKPGEEGEGGEPDETTKPITKSIPKPASAPPRPSANWSACPTRT